MASIWNPGIVLPVEFIAADAVTFLQPGATPRTVAEKLRETVSVADYLTGAATGAENNTADLQAAITAAAGKRLVGTKGHTYLVRDQLVIPSDIDIDWQGATIIDDVRTFRPPDQAERAKPLFYMYGVHDVSIKNFVYTAAATRATVSTDIPTGIIWIGDNSTTGDGPTYNIEIGNVTASNCADYTLFVSVVGNAYNLHIHDIEITGDCSYGVNVEYGEAPTGAADALAYGQHPYNVLVERFNGYDNSTSVGFLRVASAYNVKFLNCYGKDVANFIFAWTGDRSISRVSQNVKFENCSHYASSTFRSGAINYCVQVLSANKDGSTGTPLPAWTNYEHLFSFENCQFQNNKTADSAAVRFYGNQGSTVFKSCILRNSYYGVRGEPGSNPDYTSAFSLTFEDCTFLNNSRDVLLSAIRGVVFYHCKFKAPDNTLIPVSLTNSAIHNRFEKCYFAECTLASYVIVAAGCDRNEFTANTFAAGVSIASLDLSAETLGQNNSSSPALCRGGWDYFGLQGHPETTYTDVTLIPASEANAAKYRAYIALTGSVSKTINSIINGRIGDEVVFQSVSAGASVTFAHLAAVGTLNRLLCPAGANLTKTGNLWTVRAKLTEAGWLVYD